MISFSRPGPFVLGVALVALLGLAAPPTRADAPPGGDTTGYYNQLDGNHYDIYHNAWNDPSENDGWTSVDTDPYNTTGSKEGVGWTGYWSWPTANAGGDGIWAYPEAVLALASAPGGVALNKFTSIDSKWNFFLYTTGTNWYDVAYDIWVYETIGGHSYSNEIMIWTQHNHNEPDNRLPQNDKLNITIDGHQWNLKCANHGTSQYPAAYWAFELTDNDAGFLDKGYYNSYSVSLNLKDFLEYIAGLSPAVLHNYDGNGNLQSIDVGIETTLGDGTGVNWYGYNTSGYLHTTLLENHLTQ